jgi:rubrerythrin
MKSVFERGFRYEYPSQLEQYAQYQHQQMRGLIDTRRGAVNQLAYGREKLINSATYQCAWCKGYVVSATACPNCGAPR